MSSLPRSRRAFIKTSASALALLSAPSLSFGQTTTGMRLEWQQFKNTPQYASYVNAVRLMKANTNAASPASWAYWTNVHVNYCPHGTPYFLAWHRGYLYYFEQQLRLVSGDKNLCVPYWDYYKNPNIPAEFTDPSASNPLYMPRAGTNVYSALSLAPLASSVWNFQRGTANAFEPQIEDAPHNPVHNLIGGEMANMTSPRDPIFYLHHANIDRLWHAWALPDGKGIPGTSNPYSAATSAPYWAGTFTYGSGLTMPRYKTYYPGWLNFDYSDDTKPTVLPSSMLANMVREVEPVVTRPATGTFATTAARALTEGRRSLGGVSGVVLAENHVSARLPVAATGMQSLQDAISVAVRPPPKIPPGTFQSVVVVLDDLLLLGGGKNGGYFYKVYVNLPFIGDAGNARRYLLGTVGAFEVAGTTHHGPATLEYQATEVLAQFSAAELQDVTISLVRVSGDSPPRGAVLKLGEVRIEISTAPPWEPSSPSGRGNCYC
jgi:tyrosinase